MAKQNSRALFNTIAPIYGLFYNRQKIRYRQIVGSVSKKLDLSSCRMVLDVGCGTGALCSVLNEAGMAVTGIDSAERMVNFAKKQPGNGTIRFSLADAQARLPFDDRSFDISIASYVAHGMQQAERIRLYAEMSRVTKHMVIIFDYNQNRAFFTSLIEWLERGDYFRFIKNAEREMRNCVSELKGCFSEVTVIDVDNRAAWYICTPL